MMNTSKKLVACAALAVANVAAFAAAGPPVDVTDTVGTIAAQLVPIGLIGGAVLGIVVAVKAFKWIRRGI